MFNCGCEVESMSVDFNHKIGALHLANGNIPDMSATIRSFTAVLPDIKRVDTFIDGVPDTVYLYIPAIEDWNAFPHIEEVIGEIE